MLPQLFFAVDAQQDFAVDSAGLGSGQLFEAQLVAFGIEKTLQPEQSGFID